MAYSYQAEKPKIFTEEGQTRFIKIRDIAKEMLSECGAFRMGEIISRYVKQRGAADAWEVIACVDRMIETKEIREISGADELGQHRVFTYK